MLFVEIPHKNCSINFNELRTAKAVSTYNYLLNYEWAEMVEAQRTNDGADVLIFDLEVEISRKVANDIRKKERIAIEFLPKDDKTPWVYALREDFPNVAHLNDIGFQKPACLCLYEVKYDELKLDWRPASFIERIREWLSDTSQNKLHQKGQALEPFIIGSIGDFVISKKQLNSEFKLNFNRTGNSRIGVVASSDFDSDKSTIKFYRFRIPLQKQGKVVCTPLSIESLSQFLAGFLFDFNEEFFNQIKEGIDEEGSKEVHFLIEITKYDGTNVEVQETDLYAFASELHHRDLIQLVKGIEEFQEGLFDVISDKFIAPYLIHEPFNQNDALKYNGLPQSLGSIKIGIIGLGALGGQMFDTLVRMGVGQWLLIDDDVFLPHNMARHSLNSESYTKSKADSFDEFVKKNFNGTMNSQSWTINVLEKANEYELKTRLNDLDILIDCSASVPVQRKIVDLEPECKIISCFLNPQATGLVILAESEETDYISLNILESQYYRKLYRDDELHHHLKLNDDEVRYSASCNNVSKVMRGDNVKILSGIGSKEIVNALKNDSRGVKIWSLNEDGSIRFHNVEVYSHVYKKYGGWGVYIDNGLLNEIYEKRKVALPHETGGVLLGYHDMVRHEIYISEVIFSPPDSRSSSSSYTRGVEGVKEKLEEINKTTGGQVHYLGEWHSHPDRCSLQRSNDDKKQFAWIKEHMEDIGYPPLLMCNSHYLI